MLTEQWLLWIGAGAFLLFAISSLFRMKKWPTYVAFAGCLCIIAALLLRWYMSGRAPWATIYETAALLSLVTGAAASYAYRRKESRAMYLTLDVITLILLAYSAISWEAKATISPVIQSSWLYVHVPVLIIAYGLFAVSFAASAGFMILRVLGKRDKKVFGRLDRASYMSAIAGLVLLIAGVILGAMWAKITWGTYWSWDPKETWALITAVIYAVYIGARGMGMKAENAAFISILGFISVIFMYFGLAYIMPGLHGVI
jgi:ABC-type transport system involved in cytochrome c biogenesis permease subunit